jgi:hypothetical protein
LSRVSSLKSQVYSLPARLRRQPVTVRLALTIWVWLLAGVAVRIAVSRPESQSVLPIYLGAAQRWLAGGDLYAFHPPDVYRNPPGFAAGFAAFTFLPEKAANIIWRAIGAAAFLLGLRAFARHALPPLTAAQTGTLFAAAAPLVIPSLNNGQVNVLLAGAVLFGAADAARSRWWRAAAWLALAAWLKVYPLAAGLLLCVAHPRLAGRLAVTLAAGVVVPFLFQDPGYVLGEYANFLRYLGAEDRTFSFATQVPRDWTIVPRLWLDLIPPPPTAKVVAVAVGIGMAGLVLFSGRRGLGPPAFAARLALVWMTLFGPATEIPTYTLLAPVVATAIVLWRGWKAVAAWTAFGLTLAVIVRGAFPMSSILPLQTGMPIAAAILLLGLVSEGLRPPGRNVQRCVTSSAASVSAPGLGRPTSW